MPGSEQRDWIELFLDYTDGTPTPDIYRLWAGIAAVAGALERRVWIETALSKLYPNLFVLLVGRPGVGKSQAITPVGDLWKNVRGLHVAPDNLTKAALVDAVASASRRIIRSDTTLVEFHSLQIAASEFGVFVPAHDLEFLNTLNHIYDNPPSYRENRRSFGDNQIDISNPQLNIIAGTQPAYLSSLLPDEAWGMGFTSRLILIYSGDTKKVPLFTKAKTRPEQWKVLVSGLQNISKLFGEVEFSQAAQDAAEAWVDGGCKPTPDHSRLENYTARRVIHVLKLAMISAASRGLLTVEIEDFNRGRDWLLGAEIAMPDIFREMVKRSDVEVIRELHFFAWQIWIRDKRPIHESRLIHFLQNRVPSEKIAKILETCERANIFIRHAGSNAYEPRPKNEHGVE